MKSIYLLIGLLALGFLPKATAQDEKDWTLMVYMVGSDLESGSNAGSTDIAEMIAGATSTDYVNVLLMTGGSNKPGWETIRTFIIADGEQTELNWQPNSDDMSNPGNLVQFMNYATSNYPAQSYMLNFWNHGGDIRGFGWVEGTEDHLSINQIQQAVGQSSFIQSGNKLDVISFDACLMANLEVQSMLSNYAYYYVGSEETEPGHGWNWQPIIEAMEGGQALYGDEIGTVIVDAYKQHAIVNGTNNTGVTLSVTDLGEINNVNAKLQTLLNKIQTDNLEFSLQQAVSASEEYGKAAQYPSTSSDVVDLGDLMNNLSSIDNSLSAEADQVLSALNTAVVHSINDAARPKASGITVYFPHNVFGSEGELEWVRDELYAPLNISSYLKNFVLNDYIPFVEADDTPPGGFVSDAPSAFGGNSSGGGDMVSLTLEHDSDIEHVQVVLDEELAGSPNEYILLGSTFPDSIASIDENTDSYYYFWDEQWLGINGHPAYISDIHDYELEDEDGNLRTYHRIHIPAILNYETADEKNIMIGYRFDDEFNITLESIIHEHNGASASRIVPKERISLQPGDQVQLVYEVFNEVSDEEFFYAKPGAVIDITNGNEDLHLEHDQLEPGRYQIGFAIMDHSHNDTLLFVDEVFEIMASNTAENFRDNGIELFPNPSDQGFHLTYPAELANNSLLLTLVDASGKRVLSTSVNQRLFVETRNLPNGVYSLMLTDGSKIFTDQVIIQH